MSDRVPMTAEGKEKLFRELTRLKNVERPGISREIEVARGHGDLSENAEYHAAKEKQGQIEAKIKLLEDQLARADVIDLSRIDDSKVVFGVTVQLFDPESEKEHRYRIVGETEADVDRGWISVTSPLAKALIGREVGDVVRARTPKGTRELEIVEIRVDEA